MSASTATRSPTSTPQRFAATIADRRDHAERLVPGDERIPHGDRAGVLLGVAAADAARLDAEERAVGVDLGDRQLAQLELPRPGLDDRATGAGRHTAGRYSTIRG